MSAIRTKVAVQASASLRRARAALKRMEISSSFEDIEDAWNEFLVAFDSFYDKLAAGKSISNEFRKWTVDLHAKRETDPLLRYLYIARNCELHSIEDNTKRTGIGYIFSADPFCPDEKQFELRLQHPDVVIPHGKFTRSTGETVIVKPLGVRRYVKLLPVTNRKFGRVLPPDAFMNMSLVDLQPIEIGAKVLDYLDIVLDEAHFYLS